VVADINLFSRPQFRIEDFEAAALPYLAALYKTAKFLAYEPSDAEDVVQEVYLEAWKSFHRFEPGTNCRAWLFRILFHRLHHLRRRQLKSSKVESFSSPVEPDTLAALPTVPQEILDEDILQALAKVPRDFREVVLMADVQEFSYKEVAETLGIPLGTVMSRLSRGRKILRLELAEVARSYGIGAGNESESA
jgi:RNA polymerase sigma-70 factor, ECF subfamily